MNILYTINSGNFGGMERHVVDLAIGMKTKGHNVYIWCKDGPVVNILKNNNINTFIIDIKSECDLGYIYKLIKFLRSKNIQIVHAHELKAVANGMLASFLAGTKVRLSHTHTPVSEWKINPIKKIINIIVNSTVVNLFSTKEISLTESRKKKKQKEGILSKKLYVTQASNGVDINIFERSQKDKLYLKEEICSKYKINRDSLIWGYVARLTHEKGHFVLLKAFDEFLKSTKNKNHTLLFAGGGKLKRDINDYIKSHKLENNIVVTGVYPSDEIVKIYMTLDFFVHPSLAEGFGIALLEAMVSKLPVIASDLEVFQEIAKDSIVYFKKGNSADLVQKMSDLVKDRSISRTEEAYKIAQNYSLDRFIDEYEHIYQKFLNPGLV